MSNFEGKISIVVPIYNQERYLDCSIKSIQKQSYTNLEIILVNDGSTDNSENIIKKYADADNRIKIITKENGGLVDATIVGIDNATGDYICFLDPDDYIGDRFLENFIKEMDDIYDFIAAGFFRNNNGILTPCFLENNKIYNKEELKTKKNDFLYDSQRNSTSMEFFISRWNKIYKIECINEVVKQFKECKDVSLGEDTLFTYLMLKNSNKGKTIKSVNTYFYNIGNQNSMMKSGKIEKYLFQSQKAFEKFVNFLKDDKNDDTQAYILYYFLINALIDRIDLQNKKEIKLLNDLLRKNDLYQKAINRLIKKNNNKLKKIIFLIKKYNAFFIKNVTKLKRLFGIHIKEIPKVLRDLRKKGIKKAYYLHKFRIDRYNAKEDLKKNISILEERISPILQKYIGKQTELDKSPIEKNVFVFWWDGFENAPVIVKQCLLSIKKFHSDFEIIEIDKNNYKKYTDIHSEIISDFEKGIISIQTFSDILRFNLLKNNGGIWIDSTIFFFQEFDLINGLKDKSFESVCFASSNHFFEYKNTSCSWSGYFIAARKNSLLINAIDDIFREYYLKYKTFSIYFFIDAVFMICKINKIDQAVLDKVQINNNDMFLLSKILDKLYDDSCIDLIKAIPQKLMWNYHSSMNDKETFFNKTILEFNEGSKK